VTVGGITAALQYAGVSPGFVGLYQVNVVIPANVTPGAAVPVVMTQNGIGSNTATIVVR
jgi:adhesin/invasin